VSRTCTYKKTATVEGEKEKEIPGIMLYDVTDGKSRCSLLVADLLVQRHVSK
jgi:hypothetical protein